MKRISISLVLSLVYMAASAQITLSGGKNGFPLVGSKGPATIFYDKNDALVVERSAMMLSQDICDVTGQFLQPRFTFHGGDEGALR